MVGPQLQLLEAKGCLNKTTSPCLAYRGAMLEHLYAKHPSHSTMDLHVLSQPPLEEARHDPADQNGQTVSFFLIFCSVLSSSW